MKNEKNRRKSPGFIPGNEGTGLSARPAAAPVGAVYPGEDKGSEKSMAAAYGGSEAYGGNASYSDTGAARPEGAEMTDEAVQEQAENGKNAIGREEIMEAAQILQRYKQGKANLERRIVENEQWYKLRHWECMRRGSTQEVEPVSAWLFNCIANKHADAMDNFPCPNILPREEDDRQQAEMLSSIVPVILDQCDFEEVYSGAWDSKLRGGTGVYGIFWDREKHNGLGDIAICKADVLRLFWEPGVTDIQHSRHLFSVSLEDNESLIEQYPELEGKLSGTTMHVAEYIYDDSVNTQNKSAVVDWYYKKRVGGKTLLHYCKFVNDVVIFASENEPELKQQGWYDHGMYPYVFDRLFPVEGTPTGFGYIDVGKSAQEYIDRGNQALMKNLLANAKPRFFIRSDGGVNEEEYADSSNDFIHTDKSLGQDSIMPVRANALGGIYLEILNGKIDELKETTGNRDVSTGGANSGVTAASAIAAMQEAGSKLSRDSSKSAYRAYKRLILMVIELIRQFYDLPRCFRISGRHGEENFVRFSNAGLKPQHQGSFMGMDMGMRTPLFDIEISAQKASPYSRMSQNELALQFYSAGFFDPEKAEQALACVDMMEFENKQFVMQRLIENVEMHKLAMQNARLSMPGPMAGLAGMPKGGDEAGPTDKAGAYGVKENPGMRAAKTRAALGPVP